MAELLKVKNLCKDQNLDHVSFITFSWGVPRFKRAER